MPTNDFKVLATGGGANVLTQAEYIALTTFLSDGFEAGIVPSDQFNKVVRQSSTMSYVLAQFILEQSGQSVLDNGTPATIVTNLLAAVKNAVQQQVILADTGAANAYTATNAPALSALPTGSGLIQKVSIANLNTAASTYAPDGLTAKPIYGLNLTALTGGELPVAGVATLMYVVAATVNGGAGGWILLSCTGGAIQIPAASYAAGRLILKKAADIASAATINLATATGNGGHVTGTTGISAVTMSSGQFFEIIFDGILTLTHHATNNNLPTAANITTAAGDRAHYWSDGTTTYCIHYQRAAGTPLALVAGSVTASILDGAQAGSAKVFGLRSFATWNGATTGQYTPTLPFGNINDINRLDVGKYKLTFITNAPTVEHAPIFDCDSAAMSLGIPQTLTGLHQIIAKDASSATVQFYTYVGSTNTPSAFDPTRCHFHDTW